MRKGQIGLGPEPAKEMAFQPGQLVSMPVEVHPLEGVVTDVRRDEADQLIAYVRPWNGEAMPYLVEELTPITERTASTIDRFMRHALLRSMP